jgi:hypothetical protein
VAWSPTDRERISQLRDCLDSDLDGIIKTLGEELAQLKGTQSLMANARFVRRLHGVLREWLVGLLDGTFDEDHLRARREFGQRMVEADLTFEDVILLEGLARQQFAELAKKRSDGRSRALSAMLRALEKALCLDLALVHGSYLQVHDARMEQALLDRFLTITGFSRTLYQNLAETRGRNGGSEQ